MVITGNTRLFYDAVLARVARVVVAPRQFPVNKAGEGEHGNTVMAVL
jgi:hypothetical protein